MSTTLFFKFPLPKPRKQHQCLRILSDKLVTQIFGFRNYFLTFIFSALNCESLPKHSKSVTNAAERFFLQHPLNIAT